MRRSPYSFSSGKLHKLYTNDYIDNEWELFSQCNLLSIVEVTSTYESNYFKYYQRI